MLEQLSKVTKFCNDCTYFEKHDGETCHHEAAFQHIDPLYGYKAYTAASVMRQYGSLCGPIAVFYKPKND